MAGPRGLTDAIQGAGFRGFRKAVCLNGSTDQALRRRPSDTGLEGLPLG
jgi:hypothetical protein